MINAIVSPLVYNQDLRTPKELTQEIEMENIAMDVSQVIIVI